MNGLLISFEGIDFCGKTVQSQLLHDKIKQEWKSSIDRSVFIFREPGGTDISEKVRDILLDRSLVMMHPISELLLYSAARSQLIAEKIIPEKENGAVIVCDRFYDSTIAYQGYGRGIDLKLIEMANSIATHSIRPDITFIIDLDPEVAFERGRSAGLERDRLESENADFYDRVRQGFLQISRNEPDRVVVVDGTPAKENMFAEVWRIVAPRLP
jgi:dTMP kinase